jgi:hypothetical protein
VSRPSGRQEIYGGYSYLSNSFNTHSYGNGQTFGGSGLNGWSIAALFPISKSIGVKVTGLGFYGTSLGDSQRAYFFLGGAQYTKRFGKESGFVHGLAGLGHINDQALTLGGEGPQSNFSVTADAGGGLDTPISRSMAWRIEGAMLFADFKPASNQIQGTPKFFARISTGIVFHF